MSNEIVYIRPGEAAFLNVDVDVYSRAPLDPLVAALGPVLIHFVGKEGRRYSAHFSLYSPGSADRAVRKLAQLISRLPRSARKLWNEALRRVFNIGFEGGFFPHSLETTLGVDAVRAVARLGASITVTLYAVDTDSVKQSRR